MNELPIVQDSAPKKHTSTDFRLDPDRSYNYLHMEGHRTVGRQFDADTEIPIGKSDKINFGNNSDLVEEGFAYRTLAEYQEWLFPSEFRRFQEDDPEMIAHKNRLSTVRFDVEFTLQKLPRKDDAKAILGGYTEAFRAGKTVLDVGSGEALALMQLAKEFPQTSFIGVDHLYFDKTDNPKDPEDPFYSVANRQVYPGKPGLQLAYGDWRDLSCVPDNSVDTIISVQALGMWGLPNGHSTATEEDGKKIIAALTRVAKPGAILRTDMGRKFLEEHMDPKVWKVYTTEGNDSGVIARKRRSGLSEFFTELAERRQEKRPAK